MIKMFRTVSDIIDSDDPDYESIKSAYESGDYDGAVRMLLTIFRSE